MFFGAFRALFLGTGYASTPYVFADIVFYLRDGETIETKVGNIGFQR